MVTNSSGASSTHARAYVGLAAWIGDALGALTVSQMARAGAWLNLFFIGLLPVVVYLFATRVFGRV